MQKPERVAERVMALGLSVADIEAMTLVPGTEIEDALALRIPVPPVLSVFLALYGAANASARARCKRFAQARHEWKPIPGFGKYEASHLGRVRRRADGKGSMPGKVLAEKLTGHGYRVVSAFTDDGKQVGLAVHRAVALAFHGVPPEETPCGCHRDGHRENNAASNLYWGSYQQNAEDRMAHRLVQNPCTRSLTPVISSPANEKYANKTRMLQQLARRRA